MNKFNYLQIVGTTILISPLIVLGGAASAYELSQTSEEYTSDEVVEVVKVETKKDSVVVVKEVPTPPKPVVPTPTPPKPVVKDDTLPKVVVKSDSVQVEVKETKTKEDTTQITNY
jgi:LysM repeat protein